MTFIAAVVAKKGVALIADSLVTTSHSVIEAEDFLEYIKKKSEGEPDVKIDPKEILDLFKRKPSYTKDYQEKLFQYDSHTAILIAGAASLNDKNLGELIEEAKTQLNPSIEIDIQERVNGLKSFFENQVKSAIENEHRVRLSVLIVTFYSPHSHKTTVYKILINETTKADLSDPDYKIVAVELQPEHYVVVCDGQNRISESILFGGLNVIFEIIPRVAAKIFNDFGITEDKIPEGYINNIYKDKEVLTDEFYDDIKMTKITELSLQQSVDLACLLLRIERDIQRYTENIPTVGGVVKVAIINDKGLEFITGDDIKAVGFIN